MEQMEIIRVLSLYSSKVLFWVKKMLGNLIDSFVLYLIDMIYDKLLLLWQETIYWATNNIYTFSFQ